MAELTFKANLLPNSDLGKALGSSNQRWNIYGELNGNASSATKLATARNINGTAFDGTANITTANWGTARTLTIGGTGKSVNGSANVSWSKAEILGSSDTTKFYRGDQTWSNVITGGFSATGGNITAGTAGDTSGERSVRAASGAGLCYIYSAAATDGARGVWINDSTSGGGTECNLVFANGAGRVFYTDSYSHNSTALAYSQPGLAASDINWLTCWNGYELRAISKAEMANAVDSSHKWVRLAGDTMTGPLRINGTDNSSTDARLYIDHRSNNDWGIIIDKNNSYDYGMIVKCNSGGSHGIDVTGRITGTKVYGAVWNDYAEYRKTCNAKPGQCVVEISNGELKISNKRCLPAARVISDTFGFAIGETEECQTPIAVSGRVLVYIDNSNIKIGDAVCSGKNGTVSKMRWYERILYPERIVGVVSEIPDYDEWLAGEQDGNHKIKVNGRIWIYVK